MAASGALCPWTRPIQLCLLNLIANGSSEVDGQERKSKAEDGESFDPTGGAFVAKVEAAVAELLLPGGRQHVSVVDGGTE